MRVGIDLDGVLYDFVGALRDYAGMHNAPEARRWEFYEDWGWTREKFKEVCDAGVGDGEIFWRGSPIDGAVELTHALKAAGHRVVIVTARDFGSAGASRNATRSWLRAWGFHYDELHFAEDKTQFNLDWMLDDSPHVAEQFRGHPKTRFVLMDQPWNRHIEGGLTVLGPDGYRGLIEANTSNEVRVTNPTTGGAKGSKPARFDLLPAGPLWQVAELYGEGAKKYDARNWERGYDWSLSFAALQRHAWKFWGGEDIDPETRKHHLASVCFHALAMMQFTSTHPELDDRPKAEQ